MAVLQLKTLPKFPAQVIGVAPIIVTKSGLVFSISADLAALKILVGCSLGNFLVAGLPASPAEGSIAFAKNGRKVGEAALAGTGVPVYFSLAAWRVYSTDAPVLA